ncbi:hypothetical protein RIF29_10546 [Crotalaria pallida]|uniref:J domain-containing protein n=1 Tax=Crotalaria pallida TaxID=3830 RepID=A0AAN9G057_CROPI
MECNKQDALKAKELAEDRLINKDFGGARILAMKAWDLDPNLPGLSQLLAAIEVHISAERKFNGQDDWYGVLGVHPVADDETIRRRYRKLALMLHPDKNKSVGAEEAFKLITQAWSILSNKKNKIIYDGDRSSWGRYVVTPGAKPSVPAHGNGSCNNNIFNTAKWKDRELRNGTPSIPIPGSPVTLKQTFWTRCGSCKTQFEYETRYINLQLVCTSCQKAFIALEAPTPPGYINASSTSRISQMKQRNFSSSRMERNYHASGRTPTYAVNSSLGSGPFSMPGGISSVPSTASATAEAPGVYGMSSQNLKRPREDSTSVISEEGHFGKTHAVERNGAGSAFKSPCFGSNSVLIGDSSRRIRRTDEHHVRGDGRDVETKSAYQNGGMRLANEFGSQKDNLDIGRVNAAGNYKRNGSREITQQQMKNMLMEKARKEIRKKLDEWRVSSESSNLKKFKNTNAEVREENRERAGVKNAALEFVDSETISNKCFSADSEVTESLTMSVPDPDFHNFDGDRVENAFDKNQIWAAYDEDDGMPRYYALIHSVISKSPFKMEINWLTSKTNDEFAPIKWVSSGYSKTVGDLRIGKRASSSTLNSFSHRVRWTKGSRGLIHIYPKKGDVWALYRNWSADWNQYTEDEIIHKYDMVEVLEDYSEEQGVNVAPLVKVSGFKTVFRQNADPTKCRNIPKAEMFRFSHQVPSYLLTGQEGHNAPSGCLELDPAATPMELLQTAKAPQQEMATEKSLEDELKPNGNSREDAVEDAPTNSVSKAEERNESRPKILQVYKRKRLRK